jgi:hypothetical protein
MMLKTKKEVLIIIQLLEHLLKVNLSFYSKQQ